MSHCVDTTAAATADRQGGANRGLALMVEPTEPGSNSSSNKLQSLFMSHPACRGLRFHIETRPYDVRRTSSSSRVIFEDSSRERATTGKPALSICTEVTNEGRDRQVINGTMLYECCIY